ncbi:MAG TPA: enoyl-CoA hydratase, partial [Kiloniellaceae bacterium]|nr:enoyl-CoA hydratase [Kiloniellaceae bacterium]
MSAEAARASDPALLLRSDDGGIARLTLNRPQAYNALSVALMTDLLACLDDIAEEAGTRAVILQGAGKGFCAGHDLKELRAQSGDRAFFQAVFQQCSKLMVRLTTLPQPVIAQVHGIATAAGCQLVASCDLAVAAETARFGTPGVNIG